MRINAVIGATALAFTATVLVACGSSDSSSSASASSGSYCDELKADKTYFESLNGSNGDLSNFDQVFAKVHTLAADAPDNVADDWKTLDGAVTTIESPPSRKPASSPATWRGSRRARYPQGADLSKLQQLLPKLQSLNSTDVSDAAKNISDDAKKSCGIDLTSS